MLSYASMVEVLARFTRPLQSAVERYLRDLQATLGTNLDEARRLLSMAVDKIVIRREGKHLIAQVVGNFAGMFALEPDLCASVGAGSPVPMLPSTVIDRRIIA